jgi:hypothetical protein
MDLAELQDVIERTYGERDRALGAALQALEVLEPGSKIEQLVDEHMKRDEQRSCEPRPAAVSFYKDAYREYQRAVTAIAGMYA